MKRKQLEIKPYVVDAIQFTGDNMEDIQEFLNDLFYETAPKAELRRYGENEVVALSGGFLGAYSYYGIPLFVIFKNDYLVYDARPIGHSRNLYVVSDVDAKTRMLDVTNLDSWFV